MNAITYVHAQTTYKETTIAINMSTGLDQTGVVMISHYRFRIGSG